jgi:hypothetical protein
MILYLSMIHLSNFDTEIKGRVFKDKTLRMQADLTCVGYGDNQGNPYFIGMYADTTTNTVHFKTVLVKNAEFVPQ